VRLRRYSRLILVLLVIAAIVAMAMWPQSLEVDVAAVTQGPLQVTIDEDGETRVHDRFVVSAPVAGRLSRIELEPGDAVTRGRTILARLTPAEAPLLDPRTRGEFGAAVEAARAAVGQAQAERERAAAALARAKSTLQRQQALAEAGAIARDDLEAAQTALRTAEEAARAAEFAVRRAEQEQQVASARLQAPAPGGRMITVVAPVDGVVLRRVRESEAIVGPGEPLIELGDPARIEVIADLLSTDAVRVRPGADVLIEQWGGDGPLRARVRRVEPSGFMKVSALGVEEQRVNVIIDFADPAAVAKVLGDGYRVEVRIVVWREEKVVKVPVGSLFRRDAGWAAFVVEDGVAHLRSVDLGQRNENEAQILKGLSDGQTLVLHPPDSLADGMRVTVRER
jgi:HlyD family secretion protein